MKKTKFKVGDRVYSIGPGWGTVKEISDYICVHFSKEKFEHYLTVTGQLYANWDETLMTKEEALAAGFKDPEDEPQEKEVKVYQWEKMFVPKEGDPPHQYRGEVIVQQSVFMGPKGCWAERQGWTIVPGSERTLFITKEGEVYDKASRNN